jgi:hypothetical protein
MIDKAPDNLIDMSDMVNVSAAGLSASMDDVESDTLYLVRGLPGSDRIYIWRTMTKELYESFRAQGGIVTKVRVLRRTEKNFDEVVNLTEGTQLYFVIGSETTAAFDSTTLAFKKV